eukprot:scaffold17.g474.t1
MPPVDFSSAIPNKGAVLIVDTTKHPLLPYPLTLFSAAVPLDWSLYVVHGSEANQTTFVERAAAAWRGRQVTLLPLGNATANTSLLFRDPAFWHRIHAEHILVATTDSVPCCLSPYNLTSWLRFPYLGCRLGDTVPWPQAGYGAPGLSLRRRSFMLACFEAVGNASADLREEQLLWDCMNSFRGPRPTEADAAAFCTSGAMLDRSWGALSISQRFGKPQFCLNNGTACQKPALLHHCPEVDGLI